MLGETIQVGKLLLTFKAYLLLVFLAVHCTTFPLIPSPSTVLEISQSSVIGVAFGWRPLGPPPPCGSCCWGCIGIGLISGILYMAVNFRLRLPPPSARTASLLLLLALLSLFTRLLLLGSVLTAFFGSYSIHKHRTLFVWFLPISTSPLVVDFFGFEHNSCLKETRSPSKNAMNINVTSRHAHWRVTRYFFISKHPCQATCWYMRPPFARNPNYITKHIRCRWDSLDKNAHVS